MTLVDKAPAPKITIDKSAKRLPAGRLGQPYVAQLLCDAEDGEFVPGPLEGGLAIDAKGRIAGTMMGLGPHRFEVQVKSPTRGTAWMSLVVTANPPTGKNAGAAPLAGGYSQEQVDAMIAQAIGGATANIQQQISEAVAEALARHAAQDQP